MPKPGSNVTIPGEWTIIMDMDPATIDLLVIDGDVIVEDSRDSILKASCIWIRAGSLRAGNSTTSFEHKLDIVLDGSNNNKSYKIGSDLTVKQSIVVTGTISLYGTSPSTVWTRLTNKAGENDTTIEVDSLSGWALGDTIVLAPSFNNGYQYEEAIIEDINMNTITLRTTLNYTHYGEAAKSTTSIGDLDMRTTVGHLSRNIRILPSSESTSCRMVIYS